MVNQDCLGGGWLDGRVISKGQVFSLFVIYDFQIWLQVEEGFFFGGGGFFVFGVGMYVNGVFVVF